MDSLVDTVKLVCAILVSIFMLAAIGVGLVASGFVISMPFVLFLMLLCGWLAYAYVRYRRLRQEELLQVMATATEVSLPLPSAIRAYIHDRPSEGNGGGWDAILLFIFPPAYWLWHQRHNFDIRAGYVAESLEDGLSLADALSAAGNVAPREVKVAAAIGESTGRLAECLRRADRERAGGAWLEIVPRVVYPALLLLFILGVTGYLMYEIMPKFRKIFDDFHQPLPAITQSMIDVWNGAEDWAAPIVLGAFGAIVLVAIVIASPGVRWRLPIVNRVYRWDIQGLLLRMLASQVEAQRPVLDALRHLADTADLPAVVKGCVRHAARSVVQGESLAIALHRAQLLPSSMIPLVQSAERAHTLPWALAELGELLAGRSARWVRRASYIVCPALVVAVGLVAASVVIGMFFPLITLLTRLST